MRFFAVTSSVLVVLVAGVEACGADSTSTFGNEPVIDTFDAACDPPKQDTYSEPPSDAGDAGCNAFDHSAGDFYPMGTTLALPYCGAFGVQTCKCGIDYARDAAVTWLCGL